MSIDRIKRLVLQSFATGNNLLILMERNEQYTLVEEIQSFIGGTSLHIHSVYTDCHSLYGYSVLTIYGERGACLVLFEIKGEPRLPSPYRNRVMIMVETGEDGRVAYGDD